jgi:hypothetical protein
MSQMRQGILEWNLIHKDWAYILWKEPGKQRVKAVKELRSIEDRIRKEGMKGWIAESEFQYKPMHRILEKLGAKIYAKDKESFYFKKELNSHGPRPESPSTPTA